MARLSLVGVFAGALHASRHQFAAVDPLSPTLNIGGTGANAEALTYQITGDSYTILRIGAASGVPRITLYDSLTLSLNSDQRAYWDTGEFAQYARIATAVLTIRDSPVHSWFGTYWDGAQSQYRSASIRHDMTAVTPRSRLTFTIASLIPLGLANNNGTMEIGFFGVAETSRASAYTQTYATATKIHDAVTSADFPAGGVGAAAGGWDTAANRDAAIARFAALRSEVINLKDVVNSIIDDLQAYGLMQ